MENGSKESQNMGEESKKKENGGQRRRGRKEQDHLPMAGSGKVPVTTPQKPLTDLTIQLPTEIIKKGGSVGI